MLRKKPRSFMIDEVPANLNEDPSDNIQEDESEQESIESTFDAKAPVEDKKPQDRNSEKAQKESDESTEAPVTNKKTRSHQVDKKPDNLTVPTEVNLSSFQEDLNVTREILAHMGLKLKTTESSDNNVVKDEPVEEREVPPNDGVLPDFVKEEINFVDNLAHPDPEVVKEPDDLEEKTFDYEPLKEDYESEVLVETVKLEQFVEVAFEKEADEATTNSETVKVRTTEVPSVFPFDPGEVYENVEVKSNATTNSPNDDRNITEVDIETDDMKDNDDEEFFLCSSYFLSADFGNIEIKDNNSDETALIEKEPIEFEKKVRKSIVNETFDSKSIMDRATKQQDFYHQIQVSIKMLLKKRKMLWKTFQLMMTISVVVNTIMEARCFPDVDLEERSLATDDELLTDEETSKHDVPQEVNKQETFPFDPAITFTTKLC